MTRYTILDLRALLDVSQEELAREAKVDQGTISNIEQGKSVRRINARKIWFAVNRLREAQGQSSLNFEDIDWTII